MSKERSSFHIFIVTGLIYFRPEAQLAFSFRLLVICSNIRNYFQATMHDFFLCLRSYCFMTRKAAGYSLGAVYGPKPRD